MNLKLILNFIALAMFTTISISCSKQSTSELKTINVLESEVSELSISEIADDITYIPLDSKIQLAGISDVECLNDEYFIADRNKILRFNKEGTFINQLGNQGRGPGEYSWIADLLVHPVTQEIFVIWLGGHQIMAYNPDGQFTRSIDLDNGSVSSIGICESNILVFYYNMASSVNENMELLNVNGEVIRRYPNKYPFEIRGRFTLSSECLMYELNRKLYFKEIFSDTIYYFDGQEMNPKIVLNTEGKGFTPIERSNMTSIMGSSESPAGLIQFELYETVNHLFYVFHYNKKNQMLIFEKSTNKQFTINENEGVINDLDGGPNIKIRKKKDDNTVFSWIDAYELKQYVSTEAFKNSTPKYPEKKKELEQLANSLDENDNPVLMLVKLKE